MSDIPIKVVVLPHGEGLGLPAYASAEAAGCDLVAALPVGEPHLLQPGDRCLIPTGLKLALPSGFEAQVRPRSGLAHRHGLTLLNAPGTIDADYRGEILVLLINFGNAAVLIERGMRIAQLVLAPVVRARFIKTGELEPTARGVGGFGSTGCHTNDAGET
ncbi:MAG: dUTP diphosphatase [Beijerinckiaceae bacterium]|nr:dUTP diphosphatase [Beijerinckiaceae bacterium]